MDRYGLIGHPIGHSLSPRLFRAAYNGKYPYDLIDFHDFKEAWIRFLEGYRAINVTAPFKTDAFAAADWKSPECERCGATNLCLNTPDGIKAYIPAPVGVKVGDVLMNGPQAELKPGNCKAIKDIPVGLNIHCIELLPGRGAKLVRSAGQTAVLRGKDEKYAQVKLPSGEVRLINVDCRATIGQLGNLDHMNVKLGKAGKKRYLGFRPHVRGVVMNPVDHPMGGGEGRTSGGGHPVSPWGQLAKGKKTRHPKKTSSKFIVERRKK